MDHDEFSDRLKAIYDDRNAGMGALADLLTVGVESCLARLDRLEERPPEAVGGAEGPVDGIRIPGPNTWDWALMRMREGRSVYRQRWREAGAIDRRLFIDGSELVWMDMGRRFRGMVLLPDFDAVDWRLCDPADARMA